jgi:hypothetical protein
MNEFLIQKFSLFVDKQCKSLLENIIEIVDGSSFSTETSVNHKSNNNPKTIEGLLNLKNKT